MTEKGGVRWKRRERSQLRGFRKSSDGSEQTVLSDSLSGVVGKGDNVSSSISGGGGNGGRREGDDRESRVGPGARRDEGGGDGVNLRESERSILRSRPS